MPLVTIRHQTRYRYRNPVAFGEHRLMVRPMESFDQRVVSAELEISPEPALLRQIHDLAGATVGVARFTGRADKLVFDSKIVVDHNPAVPFELEGEDSRIGADGFVYAPAEADDLACAATPKHRADAAEVGAFGRRFLLPVGHTRLSTLLSKMTHAIHDDFTYTKRLYGAPQTPSETLADGSGSCRDFAVLMMEAARSLGLAARFVSGYVYSGSPKAARQGGGHTHAWVRVYIPDCGWTDFDPTNGIIGGHDLIRTAAVVDPVHATPLYGSWSGLNSDFLGMDVDVMIQAAPSSVDVAAERKANSLR
ncbi:MAG: transglutaminase domain protein [Caulobacteraceae bacterium]|nr:transglutaminase domain protein [Caulobacteraceae bacterium]